jgi:hypothetical protein
VGEGGGEGVARDVAQSCRGSVMRGSGRRAVQVYVWLLLMDNGRGLCGGLTLKSHGSFVTGMQAVAHWKVKGMSVSHETGASR